MVRAAAWVSFAAVMYLILREVLHPWVELPAPGNIGFTLIFVLFAILHCAGCFGWKLTGSFFLLAAVTSYLLEEIGVRTGWVYGAYHYSDMLGPKLGHVPVLIPLAWFMMIYPSWIVARALMRGVNTRGAAGLILLALVAALVMTAWDTVMDPGMAADGNWVWEHGGSYFGVPLRNYLGWIITTFIVYIGAGLLWRKRESLTKPDDGFYSLAVVVYASYACSYVVPRTIPALEVVALFAMLMPGLLALAQCWLPREHLTESSLQ